MYKPQNIRRDGVLGSMPYLEQFPPYDYWCVFQNHPISPAPMAELRIKPSSLPYRFSAESRKDLLRAEVSVIADKMPGTYSDNVVPDAVENLEATPGKHTVTNDGCLWIEFVWNDLRITKLGYFRFKVDFYYFVNQEDGTREKIKLCTVQSAEEFRVVAPPPARHVHFAPDA
ncbi:hypothetical protein VTJ49DRAFT_7544 [Mycothermus thermophilus]|uniref:Uncharacterized protein n=1 Tax=Humicola insolens TaxID=85995 RepID=A0ABR3VGL0_HUMIN